MESCGLEVRGQAEVRGRLLARPSEEGGVTNHTLAMHGLSTGYAQRVAYSETEQATEQPANQHNNAELDPTGWYDDQ